jgi:threonine/homoserine/homoserine lactone efflux protein
LNFDQNIYRYISIAGGVVLVYFAYSLYRAKNVSLDSDQIFFSFKKIFLLTILNGGFIVFWITVCVPLASALEKNVRGGFWFFLLIFELGWFVAMMLIAAAALFAKKWVNSEKRLNVFFKFIAICLAFFGIKMIFNL